MLHARGDRGATALEYIASIICAAMLAGAVYVAVGGSDGKIQQALCKAVGTILQNENGCSGGDDQADDPQTDEDFEPDKCKYNEKGEEFSSKVKIFFIEIGENSGFVVTQYSDGTVTMTATDGGSLGATGGVGADVSLGKLEAGAKVDFGGGFEVAYGSTWKFKNMDEANSMKDQLNKYLMEQYQMTHPPMGPMGPMPVIILNPTDPPKAPSETVSDFKLFGEVKGTLGIDVTGTSSSGTKSKIPAAQVVGSIGADSKWSVRTNNDDKTTTYTTALNLNPSVSGQIWTSTFGTKASAGASMSITKDKDGRITNITFVTTNKGSISNGGKAGGSGKNGDDSGGGSVGASSDAEQATVTTTSIAIDPDNAGEQQIARDWLGGDTNYSWSGAMSAGDLNPEVADPNDPFQNLVHSKGKVSAVTYDNVKDTVSFGLNVKLGVALGFDFSLSNSESQAVDASYLGAPDASGTRHPLPYTECVK